MCVCVLGRVGVSDREEQRSYSYCRDSSDRGGILKLQLLDVSQSNTAVAIAEWKTAAAIAFLQK